MKRLLKADNTQAIENVLNGISDDGRNLMKQLEDFKFKMEQCSKIMSNNPEIGDKINQNSDMLDKLMSGLYSICYDLENVDLVPQYDNDQINMSEQDLPDSSNSNYDLNKEIPNENDDDKTDYDLDSENNSDENEESSPLPGNGSGEGESAPAESETETNTETEEPAEEPKESEE